MTQAEQVEAFLLALQDLEGDALYAESVRRVWELLEADYVFAGDFVPAAAAVDVRALCADGELRQPYRYHLAGTPCVNTLADADNACLYLGDVVERFPHHHRLRELGVSSYIGVPILSGEAKPAGLIVVLYKGIPTETALIPIILELLSTRLSHELHRRDREQRGDEVTPQLDQERLLRRLRQSLCVLRLHFSIASQLPVSESARGELEQTVEIVKLVINRAQVRKSG